LLSEDRTRFEVQPPRGVWEKRHVRTSRYRCSRSERPLDAFAVLDPGLSLPDLDVQFPGPLAARAGAAVDQDGPAIVRYGPRAHFRAGFRIVQFATRRTDRQPCRPFKPPQYRGHRFRVL